MTSFETYAMRIWFIKPYLQKINTWELKISFFEDLTENKRF